MKHTELKPSTCYHCKWNHGSYEYIMKTRDGGIITEKCCLIRLDYLDYDHYGGGFSYNDSAEFREATQEEAEWLEACIRARRLVEKPVHVEMYPIFN